MYALQRCQALSKINSTNRAWGISILKRRGLKSTGSRVTLICPRPMLNKIKHPPTTMFRVPTPSSRGNQKRSKNKSCRCKLLSQELSCRSFVTETLTESLFVLPRDLRTFAPVIAVCARLKSILVTGEKTGFRRISFSSSSARRDED